MKQQTTRLNSVEKALQILLSFKENQPTLGVRELSASLGFSPATVQRLLQTLKGYDFISQDSETRKYRLGSIFFQFHQTLQSSYSVTWAIISYMEKLLTHTRETVHFNIVEGDYRVCSNCRESQQTLKAGMSVGNRSPLYAGASSKCLLAFSPSAFIETYLKSVSIDPITENTLVNFDQLREELDKIRAIGYASSLGERTPGLGSLSAPVFDYKGELQGSISLAIPEIRFKDYDHRKFCIEALLKIARKVSKKLGYRGFEGRP